MSFSLTAGAPRQAKDTLAVINTMIVMTGGFFTALKANLFCIESRIFLTASQDSR